MAPNWDDHAAFCTVCGAPLHERDVFGCRRKACTSCDYVQFRSPASAAAVVIARGREIVLVRRAIEPYRGQWGLPAGFQDYWESAEDAAVREAREETGLTIRISRLLAVWYTRDDPRKRSNVVVYLARAVAGELRAADDASAVGFFSLDDLPDAIAFENNKCILRSLGAEFRDRDIE